MKTTLLCGLLALTAACAAPSMAQPAGKPASEAAVIQDGVKRPYLIALPAGFDRKKTYPLIINFHGHGGNRAKLEASTSLAAHGAARGYVVITPEALPRPGDGATNWNIRREPGRADDFAFVTALLADVGQKVTIDPARIYVAGHSNGAAFTGLLVCEAPWVFAAGAMVSGDPPPMCTGAGTPSTLSIRGTADATVAYGGNGPNGAVGVTARRAEQLGCASEPKVEQAADSVERRTWSGCRNGAEVVLLTVAGGAHPWPGSQQAQRPDNSKAGQTFPATDVILDFFDAHRRKGW